MNLLRKLAVVIFLLSPMAANADLIDQGDTTLDTATDLEWLDVNLTVYKTYAAIMEGFGGYVAAGYRYATGEEVRGLFTALGDELACDNGIYCPFILTGTISQSTADTLVALLGDTTGGRKGVYGIIDGGLLSDPSYPQVGIACVEASATYQGCVRTNPGVRIDGSWGSPVFARNSLVGSFLVRQVSVPEPGSLALLGIGILGLAAARRRQKA